MAAQKKDNQASEQSALLSYEAFLAALPGYALGVLESDEMLAVDAYLQAHPELYARLDSLESTMAKLAHAAPQVPLPVQTRGAVLARAQASLERQPRSVDVALDATDISDRTKVVAGESPTWTRPVTRSALGQPRASATKLPIPARRRWWQSGEFAWPLVGIAAAATILLTVLLFQMQSTVENFRIQLEVVQQRVATLRTENNTLIQTNNALREQLLARGNQLAMLANPESSVALASQTGEALSGHLYATQRTGLLVLRGVEPLPADLTYQLWLIPDDGDPVSAGLVPIENPTVTVWETTLPLNTRQFTAVGLSIEPAGGSPAPTEIVLLGQS